MRDCYVLLFTNRRKKEQLKVMGQHEIETIIFEHLKQMCLVLV